MSRPCKNCEPGSRRPAPHPGPRCASHHREFKARQKQAAWAAHIERTYSITADEYEAIYQAQGGVCAICGIATGRTRRLAVDHDHSTGLVRGLLCKPDNRLIGRARDSAEFFRRAAEYLENPPAPAAGIHRYATNQENAE